MTEQNPVPAQGTNFYPSRRRVYPVVYCARGHATFAKKRNTKRYCPICRLTYRHDGQAPAGKQYRTEGNEKWQALRDDNGDDDLEWTEEVAKSPQAQRRLLAAIDALERAEAEARARART